VKGLIHTLAKNCASIPTSNQLRRQAKELFEAFLAARHEASRSERTLRGADAAEFALHDAQLVLALSTASTVGRAQGYVDGVTVQRLADAVQAGDLVQARAMLKTRPELANMEMVQNNEHRALHYAVLARLPEMVRC